MKSSVIIALIVCGTVLVAMPYIHNTIVMAKLTDTMVSLDKPVNLTGDLPEHADIICMVGGFVMIAAGAVAGLRSKDSK